MCVFFLFLLWCLCFLWCLCVCLLGVQPFLRFSSRSCRHQTPHIGLPPSCIFWVETAGFYYVVLIGEGVVVSFNNGTVRAKG